jgi:2-oxoglutarate ferredoxin oxidoreductase subunit beta
MREHDAPVIASDFVRHSSELTINYEPGRCEDIKMPDGSLLRLRKLDADYELHNRTAAINYVQAHQDKGEVVTGLLYLGPNEMDLHTILDTVKQPLNRLTEKELCPGSKVLETINQGLR